MNKNELETSPLPSFVFIDGFKLYVRLTEDKQLVTYKFCGETGHVRTSCEKRKREFPKLGNTFFVKKRIN